MAPTLSDLDMDLEAAVREAIWNVDAVRAMPAQLNVRVSNGRVYLSGIVQSPMAAAEVERAAADVPGVVDVTSAVLDDGNLVRQVAAALATDAATRAIPPGYRVASMFGRIVLTGRFTDETARAAVAVAQAIPGVREVTIRAI